MKKIPIWPTLATLGNLVTGFGSITEAAWGNFEKAAWLVVVAMLFDAADGRLARLTRTTSRFGAELDSLADIVSFGVAPAFLVYRFSTFQGLSDKLAWAASGLFLVCATLRLARFNVETTPDEESHRSFKGLPSPAAAGLMVSSVIMLGGIGPELPTFLVAILPFLMIVAAVLMVTRVRYPHIISQLDVGERPFSFLVLVIFFGTLMYLAPQVGLLLVFGFYAASGPIGLTIDQIIERLASTDTDDSLF